MGSVHGRSAGGKSGLPTLRIPENTFRTEAERGWVDTQCRSRIPKHVILRIWFSRRSLNPKRGIWRISVTAASRLNSDFEL